MIIMMMFLFACSKNNSSNTTTPAGSSNKVNISNFAFSSATLTVVAGTTVTWTNNDGTAHTVTADDNSYTSSSLAKGATYSHTYSTAGTYTYHCQFHTMMMGTITVRWVKVICRDWCDDHFSDSFIRDVAASRARAYGIVWNACGIERFSNRIQCFDDRMNVFDNRIIRNENRMKRNADNVK